MEPETTPEDAISQINSLLETINEIQLMDCENPDSEKKILKLEIDIRGFLRTYFRDDDKKIQDLNNDRGSYKTKHFLDPDDSVTKQKNYENDLEILKYHLIAYKRELESIDKTRQKLIVPHISSKRNTTSITSNVPPLEMSKENSLNNRKIFIVHGHVEKIKDEVESFLIQLKLEPIILHKQANRGKTIIEKVEHYSNVGFAVILLTHDDVGAKYVKYRPRNHTREEITNAKKRTNRELFKHLRGRARQNVIFEFGYFIAKLGRDHVTALCEEGIEKPSDISGLLYTAIDDAGEWKKKLAKEIDAAGIKIDKEFYDNPPETFKIDSKIYPKMRAYLMKTAFKSLNIDGDSDYSYAKDLVYGSIQNFSDDFLKDMHSVGFFDSNNRLSYMGRNFIKEALGNYIMNEFETNIEKTQ